MNIIKITSLFSVLALTAGCVPVVVGGAAVGGTAVAQERTVGTAIDDAGIQTKLKSKFFQSNVDDMFVDIDTEVVEGRVFLFGKVKTQRTYEEAQKMAWDVSGVREVINELIVTDAGKPLDYSKDAWITAQIKSRLLLEKGIRSVNYGINTVATTVYITGIADSQTEMDKVIYIARNTKYVQKVVNHSRLKTSEYRR